MEQFYFLYEWDPSLRVKTRVEIQKRECLQKICLVRSRITIDSMVIAFAAPHTFVVWFMQARLASVGFTLFYDALFLGAFLIAILTTIFRAKRSYYKSLIDAPKRRWLDWAIILGIIFGPSFIFLTFVFSLVPFIILCLLSIILHGSFALICDCGQGKALKSDLVTK